MTKQSMHAIVHRLLALGLLQQARGETDARSKPLVLTPAGRRVAATARRTFRAHEAALGRAIGHDAVDVLRATLTEVAQLLNPEGAGTSALTARSSHL
jgi:DNA-binding MarR family transcriptional regulator